MSRIDRLVARRQEAPRPIRKSQRTHRVYDKTAGKWSDERLPYHHQGDQWWRLRFVEMVERRLSGRTREKKASKTEAPKTFEKNLPKPEGMTRQEYRRLLRNAYKIAGVPWSEYKNVKRRQDQQFRNSVQEHLKLEELSRVAGV